MKEDPNQLKATADSSAYDLEFPTDGRQSHHKMGSKPPLSSNLQASFTLMKSFVGTGILALPYAFKTAGIGLSIIVTIFIAFMLTYCFILLLKTADDKFGKEKGSFQKLALNVLGNKGKYFVEGLLIVEQLGCCIGILIFTKDFLNHIFCAFELNALCNNTGFNILFALSFTVPLSLINNMHYFYIPSLAANFFIIFGLLSQMYFNSQVLHENPAIKSSFADQLGEFHFTNFSLFFGVALFSYEGVGVTFSIRDSMEKPQDLPRLLKHQLTILTVIYIIFSVISCLILGDSLEDIVFFSLPTNDPFYLLIQILYAVSALCTYPIQLFPALRIIENSKFLRAKLFTEEGRNKNRILRYFLRLCLIGFVFSIAYTAQSFHLFLNMLGSCVFTLLGFTVPIILYTVQFKNRTSLKKSVLNYSILLITSVFGIIGFVRSIKGFITIW